MAARLGILAPSGRDAGVIAGILASAGIDTAVKPDAATTFAALREGAIGGLIVAEEALSSPVLAELAAWLENQPPWSDLPVILLTFRRDAALGRPHLAEQLGNVTLLERPLHPLTLVSSARAALRARARQREAAEHVEQLAAERAALRASEQRLRDSEARYRTLFNSIDEGFCIIEFLDGPHGPLSDYVHVEANAAYERHAGIANVVGQRLREMVGDEADDWVARYGEVLRTGQPIRFERELEATGRYLELAAFRIEPPERRQVAVLFQDITARKQAENALLELNETLEKRVSEALAERRLFADIVEGTDAFVQVADPNFNWLAINKASADEFERIFGIRPRAGDNMLALLEGMPEHRAAVKAVWQRALDGEAFTEIGEFGDPGLDRRFYEMKFDVLRGPDGEQIGAYQFVQDVSERLRDQERLAEATARVHEMAKLETLGQLTGGVAHDFNNLLTPIVGALDLLHRQHGEDARSARLISGALQGAERAALLVQRLLSFARRQHLEARAIDVGALVDGMQDLIQRSIGPHIAVRIRVGDGLPAARIDPNQLELAVLNLAVNARDAMAGGGTLSISVTQRTLSSARDGLEPGDYVCLVVADDGMGMDEATLRRAVEPFFTTKGQGKGTGLGLSMVHGLAAQSDGALLLRSEPGVGTTAELWLPVAEDEAAAMGVRQRQMPVQPRRATILLVDDEDLVRAATAEMLKDMGHSVLEVTSPTAALELLRRDETVDLIVSDYLMPQMRGSELIAEARKLRPGLPALLITGYSELSASETPALPRLAKPFREADLAREVAYLVAGDRVVSLKAVRDAK